MERRRLMAAYGAHLELTPREGGMKAAIARADESPLPDPATLTEGVYASPEDLDTPHHK
jgi:cysteine synthase A